MRHLRALADTLSAAGIHRVTGNVIVDPSRYAGATAAPGWKASWLGEETGPVSAFAIGKNAWRGGSAFLSDPTPYNTRRWRSALVGEDVAVDGHAAVRAVNGAGHVLATHRSASLGAILRRQLPNSDNFTAEMLLREVGFARSGVGTRKTGIAAILAEARRLGVPVGTVLDGSGLSRKNRDSPLIFVRWLDAASALPSFPALYAALPVSCQTGTLEDRLCGRETRGAVHAKTGTLDHVRVLSGFTTTHSGKSVTFSIMLAGVTSLTAAQRHLDSAVTAIVRSNV
jgi:D-alanyl-D-alanine carboxypeptidase/D-alanyl-D-alanine-endopeptidase (penicillin-binding protein 4)